MSGNMFCFQCEQTAGCKGCTGMAGVCGKKADTAALQDVLTGKLIGIARAADNNEDKLTKETDAVIIDGLFAAVTNVNFDDEALNKLIARANAEKRRLVPNCFECTASCGSGTARYSRNAYHCTNSRRAYRKCKYNSDYG